MILSIDIFATNMMHCPHCGNWYHPILNSILLDVGEEKERRPGYTVIPKAFLETLKLNNEDVMIDAGAKRNV